MLLLLPFWVWQSGRQNSSTGFNPPTIYITAGVSDAVAWWRDSQTGLCSFLCNRHATASVVPESSQAQGGTLTKPISSACRRYAVSVREHAA